MNLVQILMNDEKVVRVWEKVGMRRGGRMAFICSTLGCSQSEMGTPRRACRATPPFSEWLSDLITVYAKVSQALLKVLF
jgi:hypothetical protein